MSRRINPWKQFVGIFIPNWLMERPEISISAKVVYGKLCFHAGKDGYCYPYVSTIADSLLMSESNTRRLLNELRKYKLIESVQRGRTQSNMYFFLDHPWMHSKPSNVEDAESLPDEQSFDYRVTAQNERSDLLETSGHTTHPQSSDRQSTGRVTDCKLAFPIREPLKEIQEENQREENKSSDGGGRGDRSLGLISPAPTMTKQMEPTDDIDYLSEKIKAWWNEYIVKVVNCPKAVVVKRDDAKAFLGLAVATNMSVSELFAELSKQIEVASVFFDGKNWFTCEWCFRKNGFDNAAKILGGNYAHRTSSSDPMNTA